MHRLVHDPYVRATVLNGLEDVLSGYDLNLADLISEFDIPSSALKDSSILISLVSYNELLNRLVTITGDNSIGLELVLTTKKAMDNIGPLALILKLGDTTGECVKNALQFLKYHSNGIAIEVIECPEKKIGELRYTALSPLSELRQLSENAIGLACTAMRFLVSDDGQNPISVSFQHQKPKDTHLHERFFSCPVSFNQPTNSMFFDLELLRLETIGADRQITDVIFSYLQGEIEKVEAKLSMSDSINALISQLLPSGQFSIELIAKAMLLHPKAIQRKLAEEGTSYTEILKNVRQKTAERLLSETGIPITNVAALCGYANSVAFNTAFKKWHNSSPGEYRKLKAEDAVLF